MRTLPARAAIFLATVTLLVGLTANAQEQTGRDVTIELDATEAPRKVLHARLVVPASPGRLTLLYPKWIPGEHGPTGPVNDMVGLEVKSAGKPVPWRRDDVDMYAVHCDVPQGAREVEVNLDYLATGARNFSAGGSATAKLAVVSWNHVLLYPKGRPIRDIGCRASIKLPPGWKLGTALPVASTQPSPQGDRVEFKTVSAEALVDSPVLCGLHVKDVPIGPPAERGLPPHFITIAADSEAALNLSPALKQGYDRLVGEAGSLFGSRPYPSYRFLLTLSDHVTHFGLEHHHSSDNRVPERILLDDDIRKGGHAALLPHEFVHSWNGKYRRPADMVTPTFQEPQQTRLLWVYEGLTQYLGVVLTARSGLWTDEQARDVLASIAEGMRNRRGRTWRPLDDTAAAAQLLFHAPREGTSWRRGTDFYNEGVLLWLEADGVIRKQSGGQKSLDDFCRRFFAAGPNDPQVKPYSFDDIVAGLNKVAPHDWAAFFRKRVQDVAPEPPLAGITDGGWEVDYVDKPSGYQEAAEKAGKFVDESVSIGLLVKEEDGVITDVIHGKAAHVAGIGPSMKLIGVNGRRFSPRVLRDAIAATKDGGKLELLVENEEFFRTFTLNYDGGRRHPRLRRREDVPDVLSLVLAPRVQRDGTAAGK